MIDIRTETLIPLNAACRLLPGRAGRPISRSTLWRWALKGRRGVRLETVLLGDRMTSMESLQRFVTMLNATLPATKPADIGRDADRVVKALEMEGFF